MNECSLARGCLRNIPACLVTLVAVLFSGLTVQGSELRLMTFNVKDDAASLFNLFDAERSWRYVNLTDLENPIDGPHRRDRAISVIDTFGPDILSVQELKNNQRADLLNAFPGMVYYGLGRNGGNSGDGNGIFFRDDRFDLLDQGDFWLSETPDTPRTTFVGNGSDTGNPRMATWVKLFDYETSKSYFVLSTHWSLDSQARRDSGSLIQDMLPSLAGDLPILLLGDLKATSGNSAVRTLRGETNANEVQLTDSFSQTGGSNGRTFHNWSGGISGSRIDHVLHSPDDFEATSAEIIRTTFDGGLYPSDHYPVTVTLQVVSEPSTLALAGVFILVMVVRRACGGRARRSSPL